MRKRTYGAVVLVTLALSACGGGGDAVSTNGAEPGPSGTLAVNPTEAAQETQPAPAPQAWLVPIEPSREEPGKEEPPGPEPRTPSPATQAWAKQVAALFGEGYDLGTVSELVEPSGSTIVTVQLRSKAGTLRISSQQLQDPLQILPANVPDGGPLGSYTQTKGSGETLVVRLDAATEADSKDVRIYRVDERGRMVVVNSVLLEPSGEQPAPPLSEDELVAKSDQIIDLKVGDK